MKSNFQKGYIAITAAILLSLLILVIAVALGTRSALSRTAALDFSFKKVSLSAARACLDQALLKLALDPNYVGNEVMSLIGTSYQCQIYPIENLPPNKIIKSRSQVSGATTNLKLTVTASQLSTVSLEEVTNFWYH